MNPRIKPHICERQQGIIAAYEEAEGKWVKNITLRMKLICHSCSAIGQHTSKGNTGNLDPHGISRKSLRCKTCGKSRLYEKAICDTIEAKLITQEDMAEYFAAHISACTQIDMIRSEQALQTTAGQTKLTNMFKHTPPPKPKRDDNEENEQQENEKKKRMKVEKCEQMQIEETKKPEDHECYDDESEDEIETIDLEEGSLPERDQYEENQDTESEGEDEQDAAHPGLIPTTEKNTKAIGRENSSNPPRDEEEETKKLNLEIQKEIRRLEHLWTKAREEGEEATRRQTQIMNETRKQIEEMKQKKTENDKLAEGIKEVKKADKIIQDTKEILTQHKDVLHESVRGAFDKLLATTMAMQQQMVRKDKRIIQLEGENDKLNQKCEETKREARERWGDQQRRETGPPKVIKGAYQPDWSAYHRNRAENGPQYENRHGNKSEQKGPYVEKVGYTNVPVVYKDQRGIRAKRDKGETVTTADVTKVKLHGRSFTNTMAVKYGDLMQPAAYTHKYPTVEDPTGGKKNLKYEIITTKLRKPLGTLNPYKEMRGFHAKYLRIAKGVESMSFIGKSLSQYVLHPFEAQHIKGQLKDYIITDYNVYDSLNDTHFKSEYEKEEIRNLMFRRIVNWAARHEDEAIRETIYEQLKEEDRELCRKEVRLKMNRLGTTIPEVVYKPRPVVDRKEKQRATAPQNKEISKKNDEMEIDSTPNQYEILAGTENQNNRNTAGPSNSLEARDQ